MTIQFKTRTEMSEAFNEINDNSRIISWNNMMKEIEIDEDDSDLEVIQKYL